jgi:hypothetical protein
VRAPLPLLVLVLALAGCAQPGTPAPATPRDHYVPPPLPGGTWLEPCPPQNAIPVAIDFRAEATNDSQGRGPGVHRLDDSTILWVYAQYNATDRQDRVSRLNQVDVARVPDGRFVACTRVDLVTPVQVDGANRSYAVAVRFTAPHGLPQAPLRFTVNWIAGCTPCDPLPRGNDTADFP